MSTTTLRFQGQDHSLEIDATIEKDDSLPSSGDACVQVSVRSSGFVGHNDLWLHHSDLTEFARQLVELDRTLKGEAKLTSISPNELELIVRSVSSRGNLALSGSTGYWVQSENTRFWHAVSFGFEFETGQLSEAINGTWLVHYMA